MTNWLRVRLEYSSAPFLPESLIILIRGRIATTKGGGSVTKYRSYQSFQADFISLSRAKNAADLANKI